MKKGGQEKIRKEVKEKKRKANKKKKNKKIIFFFLKKRKESKKKEEKKAVHRGLRQSPLLQVAHQKSRLFFELKRVNIHLAGKF
jgi:hypothetical protein